MKKYYILLLVYVFCSFFIPKTFAENKTVKSPHIEFKLIKDDSDKNNLIFEDRSPISIQDILSAELLITLATANNLENYLPELQGKVVKGVQIQLNLTDDGKEKLLNLPIKYKNKRSLAFFVDGKYRTSIFITLKPEILMLHNFSEKKAESLVNAINSQNRVK